ncbi:MAG TPA: Clp protease N-terminal domain-containing protein [Streptosporangiaceae bacterium]|jgi:hypothetical protein
MADERASHSYLEAIRRAFEFAREVGSGCRPVHFLVGIADGDDAAARALRPAARALRPADGRSLRAVVAEQSARAGGAPAAYLHMQAQQGARWLADHHGQPPAPAHLLVALIDQGTPEVTDALGRAGLDPAAVRRSLLAELGLPADEPSVAFEPVTPAGTLDRPPLPVAELDPRAWSVLRWRQDHLPAGQLHGWRDTEALIHLERAAAGRLADQLGLDDDQRYSLLWRHETAVDDRVAELRPEVARLGGEALLAASRVRARLRMRRVRGLRQLSFLLGWGVWFGNRRAALWDRWFRLRTLTAYRGAPQIEHAQP